MSQPNPTGTIFACAVKVRYSGPWDGLLFFEQRHDLGAVESFLGRQQPCARFEQCAQQRVAHVARADYSGGNAVDAGVEIVKADRYTGQGLTADDFACDRLGRIVRQHNVIAVPPYRPLDVKHDFVKKTQRGRYFVRNIFGGMEMASVRGQHDLAAHRVGQVEVV